jgi:hypothetical protein
MTGKDKVDRGQLLDLVDEGLGTRTSGVTGAHNIKGVNASLDIRRSLLQPEGGQHLELAPGQPEGVGDRIR